MTLKKLKPKPGIAIRLPDGTPWPAAGEWVDPTDLYIVRRVQDGDLVDAADEPPVPAKTKEKP